MTFYPFDQQTCDLTVTPWFQDQTKVRLAVLSDAWATGNMEESGVWAVSSTSSAAYVSRGAWHVDFTLVVNRKPLFLTLVLVLPVLLLSLLTGFLFLLPPGSGERSGFSITCFLSFTVVLQVLMQFLPETSVRMSILCFYIICMLMFSAGLSIVNLLILRMYLSPSADKIPSWLLLLVKIARCIPCRLCYRRCQCRRKLKSCCRRCCDTLILPVCRYCGKEICICWQKFGWCRCECHDETDSSPYDFNVNTKFQKSRRGFADTEEDILNLNMIQTGLRVRASAKLSQVSPMNSKVKGLLNGRISYTNNGAYDNGEYSDTPASLESTEDDGYNTVSSANTGSTQSTILSRIKPALPAADIGYGSDIGEVSDDDDGPGMTTSVKGVHEAEEDPEDIDEVENTPAFLAMLTWEMIAKILDVFFIIVFVVVQTVFTLIFLTPLMARK